MLRVAYCVPLFHLKEIVNTTWSVLHYLIFEFMFIVISKYLVPSGYRGITLFPFIFLKYKEDKTNTVLVNHEKIHIKQQRELLILPFFIWYGLEYLVRLFYHKNKNIAYRNISFEREAYFYENDFNYLKKRSFWAFLRFR